MKSQLKLVVDRKKIYQEKRNKLCKKWKMTNERKLLCLERRRDRKDT